MSLAVIQPTQDYIPPQLTIIHPNKIYFPDLDAAIADLLTHCDSLPSSTTPEKHTRRAYEPIAYRFKTFCLEHKSLPDKSLMEKWRAFLVERYKDSTISKYMVIARAICLRLSEQYISMDMTDVRQYIALNELRQSILNASRIKDPPKKHKTSVAGVDKHGKRLGMEETQRLFDQINRNSLNGKRDYALGATFFLTSLRLAEVSRLTLDNIKEVGAGQFIIEVRRKGSKYNPCVLPAPAYRAIGSYVEVYNDGLALTDPRRIGPTTQLWMPISPAGNYRKDAKPISQRAIANIIHKRFGIAPHDTRRTWAAWARDLEMPREYIKEQMAHESFEQTLEYIGEKANYSRWDITSYDLKLKLSS
jgi:integrase